MTLNKGYNALTGGVPGLKWGPRPDVGVLYKSGRIKAIEIASKSDNLNFLKLKNDRLFRRYNLNGSTSVYTGARILNKFWPK